MGKNLRSSVTPNDYWGRFGPNREEGQALACHCLAKVTGRV